MIVRQLTGFTDCNASFGNFSLFDRALSLREVKSIYDLDKDLYGAVELRRRRLPKGGWSMAEYATLSRRERCSLAAM